MSKDSDQAFLFGEAILNDLVADEKCLHGRFWDIAHITILEKSGAKGKTVFVAYGKTRSARNAQGTMSGKHASE